LGVNATLCANLNNCPIGGRVSMGTHTWG